MIWGTNSRTASASWSLFSPLYHGVCRLPQTDQSRTSGLCGRSSPGQQCAHLDHWCGFCLHPHCSQTVAAGGHLIHIRHIDNERFYNHVHLFPTIKFCYLLPCGGRDFAQVHRSLSKSINCPWWVPSSKLCSSDASYVVPCTDVFLVLPHPVFPLKGRKNLTLVMRAGDVRIIVADTGAQFAKGTVLHGDMIKWLHKLSCARACVREYVRACVCFSAQTFIDLGHNLLICHEKKMAYG